MMDILIASALTLFLMIIGLGFLGAMVLIPLYFVGWIVAKILIAIFGEG